MACELHVPRGEGRRGHAVEDAGRAGPQLAEKVAAPDDLLRNPAEIVGALGHAHSRPGTMIEGLPCRRHRAVYVGLTSLGDGDVDFLGGGHDDVGTVAARRPDPPASHIYAIHIPPRAIPLEHPPSPPCYKSIP